MIDLNIILTILIIITVLQIISNICNNSNKKELFAPYLADDLDDNAPVDNTYYLNTPSVGWLSRRGLLPFWNSTTYSLYLS